MLSVSVLPADADGYGPFWQRVFYTSQDVDGPYTGPAIKAIRPHWALSSTLTVVYADGTKRIISRDSIWGYEDRRGRVFRYCKHDFYRLVDTDKLVRYHVLRPTGRGVANMQYYSQDLDTPIRWTKRKARRDSVVVR